MKKWLFLLAMVLAAIYTALNLHVFAAKAVDVPACRQTKYPGVCADSYHKCNNIGLDDACLAIAKLEGEIGHSVTHSGLSGMSQNVKTGEKPVDSGDK